MTNSSVPDQSNQPIVLLSRLLLSSHAGILTSGMPSWRSAGAGPAAREEFDSFVDLANTNHVIVRGLKRLLDVTPDSQDPIYREWAETALEAERARIQNAISFLHEICAAFEERGHDVTVIKSLDHWPDIGSDLDLYTNADPEQVCQLMQTRFQAQIATRSWGDRLACKWNFLLPGLPEAVEIHMGRLGQTGEQAVLASRIAAHARTIEIQGRAFRVPSVSDRLMISTLQRMYRHFYFRLCDVVDTVELAEKGAIDYENLRESAQIAGIWEGVATYLQIVSDHLRKYRGEGLALPRFVIASAQFGGERVSFERGFLRIPIMPESAALYRTQLTGLIRRREFHNSARLGLLPWLATAAVVGQKITGSDKGIW